MYPLSADIKKENQFLASPGRSYIYGDLLKFEQYLIEEFLNEPLLSESRPLGLWADSSDLTVFLIAACWRLNIPFFCLNPNVKSQALQQQIEALQPGLICCGTQKVKRKLHSVSAKIALLDLSQILAKGSLKNHTFEEYSGAQKNDIFGYFFTSGTTQKPKIVPLKRRQMLAAAQASAHNIKPKPNQYWLLCMPLHHVGGVSLILRSLIYGSAIYRIKEFDAALVADLLTENSRFAVASLVPTMLKRMLEYSSFSTHDQFKGILLGGGPIPPKLLKECVGRQIPVIPSFGMTETCAQIAANVITSDHPKNNYESVGRIFEPNKIEIRNAAGDKKTGNKSGVIWLKGPQVFDGYLNETNNKSAFDENGWFNTGDYGRLNKENQLYIEARRTDLIVTGGENVSPFEIEAALESLSPVKEAAVFGVPDDEWGQRVVAAVVINSQMETSKIKLEEILKKEFPSFKIPKKFIFVDELPRTSTGKIRRGELIGLLT